MVAPRPFLPRFAAAPRRELENKGLDKHALAAALAHLAPNGVPESAWEALGKRVAGREARVSSDGRVDASQWVSLRLSGVGFVGAVRALRRLGALEADGGTAAALRPRSASEGNGGGGGAVEDDGALAPPGWSERVAACMVAALRALMGRFGARLGFVHGDELVVFLPPRSEGGLPSAASAPPASASAPSSGRASPTSNSRAASAAVAAVAAVAPAAAPVTAPTDSAANGQAAAAAAAAAAATATSDDDEHERRGVSMGRLATLAAGCASTTFALELAQRCAAAGAPLADLGALAAVAPQFECAVGTWGAWEEAQAVLLWRSRANALRAVGTTARRAPGGSHSAVASLGPLEQLRWLDEQKRLPLPPEEADGVVLARVKRLVKAGAGAGAGAGGEATAQQKAAPHAAAVLRVDFERIGSGPVLSLVAKGALGPYLSRSVVLR